MPSHIVSAGREPRRSHHGTFSSKHLRVLVVDDHVDILNVLRLLLGLAHFDVDIATSGEDAVSAIRVRPPDVVVLDVELPHLAGAELVAELRRDHPGLPIVVLTGYPKNDPRVSAMLDTGRCVYVSKPVTLAELVPLIEHLGRSWRNEANAELD